MINNSWKTYWEDKALMDNEITVTGRSNITDTDFSNIQSDIIKKMNFEKQDIVLDIGCANALFDISISPIVKIVVGLDFSKNMLSRAKRNINKYNKIMLVLGDLEHLPFAGNKFDKILCYSVIHYLNNIDEVKKMILEMKKVGKHRSIAFIGDIPDQNQKQKYIDGIFKLNLPDDVKKQIFLRNKKSVWYNPKDLLNIISNMSVDGKILRQSDKLPFSTYRYDLLIRF